MPSAAQSLARIRYESLASSKLIRHKEEIAAITGMHAISIPSKMKVQAAIRSLEPPKLMAQRCKGVFHTTGHPYLRLF